MDAPVGPDMQFEAEREIVAARGLVCAKLSTKVEVEGVGVIDVDVTASGRLVTNCYHSPMENLKVANWVPDAGRG